MDRADGVMIMNYRAERDTTRWLNPHRDTRITRSNDQPRHRLLI